jgi:hypothetical protein
MLHWKWFAAAEVARKRHCVALLGTVLQRNTQQWSLEQTFKGCVCYHVNMTVYLQYLIVVVVAAVSSTVQSYEKQLTLSVVHLFNAISLCLMVFYDRLE